MTEMKTESARIAREHFEQIEEMQRYRMSLEKENKQLRRDVNTMKEKLQYARDEMKNKRSHKPVDSMVTNFTRSVDNNKVVCSFLQESSCSIVNFFRKAIKTVVEDDLS